MFVEHPKSVVFVAPNVKSNRTAEENVGIGYLASKLRIENYHVHVIDAWLEDLTSEEIVSRICDIENVLFVGFSCYRTSMPEAILVLETLRSKQLMVPTIVGGFGPTFYPEEFLRKTK